ncbi:MAG: DUF2232 domain-containing protein [Notoacmeibacter sp.]|nr:DUF2232 domain-containing protein [Notoacmeibacter sp.]MCC0033131.1 DUF2232 domain-containing protein [Brucellaceae bacterium]
MNPQIQTIATGIAAGFATAALAAALSNGAALFFVLAPLPVMLASLGWGVSAGTVAAMVAVGAVTLAVSPNSGMLVALTIVLPATLAAQIANLARPAEEVGGPSGKLVWFPLADIVLWTAIMLGIGFILAGVLIGFGPEFSAGLAAAMKEAMTLSGQEAKISPEQIESIARMMAAVLPALMPGTWVIIMMANFYLALSILARAGMAKRPRDDWPTALRLPRAGLYLFGAALAAAFLPGGPGQAAAALAGALGAAFIMAGFATLHARTRGADWRAPALGLAYVATVFFSPVLFLFLVAGLFDTRRQAVLSDARGPDKPNS